MVLVLARLPLILAGPTLQHLLEFPPLVLNPLGYLIDPTIPFPLATALHDLASPLLQHRIIQIILISTQLRFQMYHNIGQTCINFFSGFYFILQLCVTLLEVGYLLLEFLLCEGEL